MTLFERALLDDYSFQIWSLSHSSKDIGQVKVDNRRQGKSNVKFGLIILWCQALWGCICIFKKNHFVAGTILANLYDISDVTPVVLQGILPILPPHKSRKWFVYDFQMIIHMSC